MEHQESLSHDCCPTPRAALTGGWGHLHLTASHPIALSLGRDAQAGWWRGADFSLPHAICLAKRFQSRQEG